ncbi:SLBB domain-containing protein [Celerinatantimonas yamalensis]|uniref:SLBB domain-containing protein n=1 Tax=Celerinatantimonas yamalensis TaxID=559956 RepID=A0ABW9G657_9GAMM
MKIATITWTLLFSALISYTASAANFSAAQIAQFKQLPQAEQQALAKQYGVDLSSLTGGSDASQKTPAQSTIEPRKLDTAPAKASEPQTNSNGLIDFGYDLFASQPSSYTPVDDLPVPNNYLIAPGDEIDIQLFGSQNQSYQLDVGRDGAVQFPQLGPIHVAGQTFKELKANLTHRIKKQILGVDLSISLGSLRTMQVYVTGDVYQPGAYNIPSLATVTQALIAAGGFRKTGSLRTIVIRRNHKVIDRLDLYDLLLEGKTNHDIRLESGDTVFVGAKGASASISGQVRRPAVYEIKPGETLGRLLKDAGGSSAAAYLQQVEIKRFQADGVHVITADLSRAKGRDLVLKDGDSIRIHRVSDQLQNVVMIRGAVTRQGAYAFHQGMKISDLFTNASDDLLPNTDQNYALLVREIDPEHHIKVLQFNLGDAIRSPLGKQNLTLQDNDQLFVFADALNVKAWEEPSAKPLVNQHAAANSNDATNAVTINPDSGVQVVNDKKPQPHFLDHSGNQQEAAGPDSRQNLLQPILQRLQQQAVNGEPLQEYVISGSVPYPGTYPLVEGATLKDAVAAAGGLLESAAKDEAELTRSVVMPGKISLYHQRFDLVKTLTGQAPDFALQSKDRIEIQRKTNWTVDNTVEIQGEVNHPGIYTIGKGESIADLVARAGGLTQYAYPQGAIFSRAILRAQEQQRMKMLADNLRQEIASLALRRQTTSAQYTTSPTDALKVVDDLNSVPAMGRLVINLPKILRGNENDDVSLENGDKLYIPPKRNTISVMGQVQLASNFTFDPSKSVQQYIDMAGGEKKQADDERIYVIRANGAVMLPNQSYWFARSSKPLQPGDTIIVPINTDYLDGLSTLSTATQIMYQLGVAWKAVK